MGKTSLYMFKYIQKQAGNQETVCVVQVNKFPAFTVQSISRFKTIPLYLVYVCDKVLVARGLQGWLL